ncbi:MAG: hypothetical protein P8179_09210 [Candidatus Thiodiazotropha sp.]
MCACAVAGQGSPCTACSNAGIARYSKELQRRHAPPQVSHSRCSVIHPIGDDDHRSYFPQNQEPAIRHRAVN